MPQIETPAVLPPAIDHAERKLANARRVRDDAMSKLEASRRGVNKLDRDAYSDQKVRHGNAEAAVEHWKHALDNLCRWHDGRLSCDWMRAQYEMNLTKVSLTQVWRLWRDVLDARKVLADLEVKLPQPTREYFEADYGRDVPELFVGTALQRIEAGVARDRAAGLYDLALRAFEGRASRSHEKTLDINQLVRQPTRPEPSRRPTDQRRRAAAKRASMNWE